MTQIKAPSVKITIETFKKVFLPINPSSQPESIIRQAFAIIYDVTTHFASSFVAAK